MAMKTQKNRKSERGSALVYILIAIALLAALTVTFMEPSSQQTSSQSGFRTSAEVKGQVDVIRSSVQECILRYSRGDNAIPNGNSESEEGAHIVYPINPNSPYLPAASRSGDQLVRNIRCPGNNPGPPSQNDHQPIFGGNTGKYLPTPPSLFTDWQWYNGNDGVFFWMSTDKSDAYLKSSLEKIDETYSECEVDIIDTQGGSAVNIDSDGAVSCPADSLCFRVWMIANDATAVHADNAAGCGNAAP